ncbi:hypothetical protein BKA62DRAFT_310344 [Auriculariales sp. MPI-PUGE-AT-0066]|nr:hypothetical protein BKA62DRAFT_310344 [Auriculariales sp. MPI-PUGE-AT-0066]
MAPIRTKGTPSRSSSPTSPSPSPPPKPVRTPAWIGTKFSCRRDVRSPNEAIEVLDQLKRSESVRNDPTRRADFDLLTAAYSPTQLFKSYDTVCCKILDVMDKHSSWLFDLSGHVDDETPVTELPRLFRYMCEGFAVVRCKPHAGATKILVVKRPPVPSTTDSQLAEPGAGPPSSTQVPLPRAKGAVAGKRAATTRTIPPARDGATAANAEEVRFLNRVERALITAARESFGSALDLWKSNKLKTDDFISHSLALFVYEENRLPYRHESMVPEFFNAFLVGRGYELTRHNVRPTCAARRCRPRLVTLPSKDSSLSLTAQA